MRPPHLRWTIYDRARLELVFLRGQMKVCLFGVHLSCGTSASSYLPQLSGYPKGRIAFAPAGLSMSVGEAGLGGAELQGIYGMAPVFEGLGAILVITSYIDKLHISIFACKVN